MTMLDYLPYLFVAVIAVIFLTSAIRILREYQRGVIFTLGRFTGVKGPGLIILVPGEGRSPGRRPQRAAAGCDLARQRLGQGQRRALFSDRRS